jgi:haloalkane dehalogenase
MREFTKNLFSLSWAMSLFGARQLTRLLNPQEVLRGAPDSAKELDSVTDAVVDQFGRQLRETFEVGDRLQAEIVDAVFRFVPGFAPPAGRGQQGGAGARSWQPQPGGTSWDAPTAQRPGNGGGFGGLIPPRPGAPGGRPGLQPAIFDAHTTADEQVLITYTRGTGRFSEDKQYIALYNQIYNLDGTENGIHQGVWQALFSSPADLLSRPAPPTGPMNEPVGPVPSWPVSANTIAKWTHADGSSISSVGPAASHLIPLTDGGFLFLVITGQIITEGTGRFAGARGLTQSLGATYVTAGTNLFSPQGPSSFPALTLDTFKFVTVRSGSSSSNGRSSGATSSPKPAAAGRSDAEPAACAVTPDPGESKFVDVLGSRMHYIDTGSGEPILFLHGNPVWSYIWRQVLPQVSPTARCIAPDLIGAGLSGKPDIQYTFFDHVRYVEGFLDRLNLKKFTMVLHDWGCIIGFYIAMRRESQIRGLAFMEAMLAPYPTWDAFPKDLTPQFKQFRTPGVGYKLIVEDNVFVEQVLPASTMVPFTEQEMNCYRQPFLDPPSRKMILEFVNQLPVAGQPADVARATGRYASWLKRTQIPKLFLWAEPGIITSAQDVEWAKRNYKNIKTSLLGKGLHFHQQEHPVEVGQEVAKWHQEILGTRSCGCRNRPCSCNTTSCGCGDKSCTCGRSKSQGCSRRSTRKDG